LQVSNPESVLPRCLKINRIKALTDQSINEFVRNFRLKRAAQLIAASQPPEARALIRLALIPYPIFSKCFKELFGIRPNLYASKRTVASNFSFVFSAF
jgi:transcriptional regulator GlxA family with amidase domain